MEHDEAIRKFLRQADIEVLDTETAHQALARARSISVEPLVKELKELREWKAGAIKQLKRSGDLQALLPMPYYWGWDVYDATVDYVTRLKVQWRSSFDFPEKDGEYLVYVVDDNRTEYRIGSFHRQTKDVGHWHPAWGLKLWCEIPEGAPEMLKQGS